MFLVKKGGIENDYSITTQITEVKTMKQEFYSNEQLPCMLNAKDVERYMRISRAEAYEQMHSEGFPLIRIGKRMLAPRDKFLEWVDNQTAR